METNLSVYQKTLRLLESGEKKFKYHGKSYSVNELGLCYALICVWKNEYDLEKSGDELGWQVFDEFGEIYRNRPSDEKLDYNWRLETLKKCIEKMENKKIWQIAQLIRDDWQKQKGGINFAARPYLDAMRQMDSVSDSFGQDSCKSIITYFLVNASQWKGEEARRIKKHLKTMINGHK